MIYNLFIIDKYNKNFFFFLKKKMYINKIKYEDKV